MTLLQSASQQVNPLAHRRVFGYGTGTGAESLLVAPTMAPVLDVQTSLGSTEASLTWTASNKIYSSGFGYKVEVDIDGGGYSVLGTTTNRFYTDDQVSAAGETYTYRITPFNDYGEGPNSNEVGVALPGESEGPVLTGPENVIGDSYTLEWTAVAGATSYDLYYLVLPEDPPFALLTNTTELEYDATGVEDSRQYYVIAKNGSIESEPSNTHTVYLIIPAPTYNYFRPDGTSTYYRPGGVDTYIRP